VLGVKSCMAKKLHGRPLHLDYPSLILSMLSCDKKKSGYTAYSGYVKIMFRS